MKGMSTILGRWCRTDEKKNGLAIAQKTTFSTIPLLTLSFSIRAGRYAFLKHNVVISLAQLNGPC